MRTIDADTLLEKVEKIQPWDAYLGKYAQGIRHCMELVSLLIQDAPTIEPSAQPEIKPIDYQDCANAMMRMLMDNVVTDGEYNRIMDKLNAFWRTRNERFDRQTGGD